MKKITKEKENKIIEMYNKLIPIKIIIENNNIGEGTIYNILRRNNINLKEKRIKTNGEKFGEDSCGVNINDKYLSLALMKKGIVPNKTFLLKMPKINKKLLSHFIRGYMDGDGNISVHRDKWLHYNVCFVGTESLVKDISKLLLKYFKIKSIVLKKKNIYHCIFSGWKNAYLFLKLIYKNYSDSIFLERKYKKYLEFCEFYKIILKNGWNEIGGNYPSSKLEKKDVIKIRKLYKNNVRICDLSRRYKVHRGTINDIVLNRSWINI